MVVLRRDDDVPIGLADLCGPFCHDGRLGDLRSHGRDGMVEERQGPVAKIDELSAHVRSLLKLAQQVVRRLVAEPALSRAAEDHLDVQGRRHRVQVSMVLYRDKQVTNAHEN